jgi:hypothetical protein
MSLLGLSPPARVCSIHVIHNHALPLHSQSVSARVRDFSFIHLRAAHHLARLLSSVRDSCIAGALW